jgi:hypothetical protein
MAWVGLYRSSSKNGPQAGLQSTLPINLGSTLWPMGLGRQPVDEALD